jgi:hypothetical protein
VNATTTLLRIGPIVDSDPEHSLRYAMHGILRLLRPFRRPRMLQSLPRLQRTARNGSRGHSVTRVAVMSACFWSAQRFRLCRSNSFAAAAGSVRVIFSPQRLGHLSHARVSPAVRLLQPEALNVVKERWNSWICRWDTRKLICTAPLLSAPSRPNQPISSGASPNVPADIHFPCACHHGQILASDMMMPPSTMKAPPRRTEPDGICLKKSHEMS